ncbi:MAG: thioredoxin family protein [Terricaulis sp.]
MRGVAVLALTATFAWRPLAGVAPVEAVVAEAWSPERVEALRAEGKPIFVNFTAAWCVTCKVNEGVAFTPRVSAAFAERGITYLKGDWTNRDDIIAAELAQHGARGRAALSLLSGGRRAHRAAAAFDRRHCSQRNTTEAENEHVRFQTHLDGRPARQWPSLPARVVFC